MSEELTSPEGDLWDLKRIDLNDVTVETSLPSPPSPPGPTEEREEGEGEELSTGSVAEERDISTKQRASALATYVLLV